MNDTVTDTVAQTAGALQPYYNRHVFCCMNEREAGHPRGCCMEKGGAELRAYMKDQARALKLKRVRINQAGCLDRCELGPTMVIYPEGIWYTYSTKEDVDEILQTHLIEGRVVARLLLQPEEKEARK
ncbi:MAG: (2Fe-2S) ferredoxin domain-containing protein [Proteobacteria bacterium]|nr:(2Fe-2S) ferredoxin domain-containing protein [Pseudomonadota bacterium]MDA1057854.1 (2Fe-2S) ferredoxin domain-containing protein [Pseudomonadota bacterium]